MHLVCMHNKCKSTAKTDFGMEYQTLLLEVKDHIAHVKLNQPAKANALDKSAWEELGSVFELLNTEENVRVIILSGEGKHFCSGIDLSLLKTVSADSDPGCASRSREKLRKLILGLQAHVSAIENCSKPVIAAVSGGCIGAGLDVICACDMRYASEDAFFSIREIDMGMVADLGTLQRLPKLISEAYVREMAYTGRNVTAHEAEKTGLTNITYADRQTLLDSVYELARSIASKSPVAVRGTKHILNYSRDHSISDSLEYIATWNAAMLVSEDLRIAFEAKIAKTIPDFRN